MSRLSSMEATVTLVADADVDVDVQEATVEEGRAILDRAARRWLDMSGEEFLARWHRGEFAVDGEADPDLAKVVLLIPFAE